MPSPFRARCWHDFRRLPLRFVSHVEGGIIMTISRILVPTDFSPDADAAFAYAMQLATALGASVDLVHVVEDPMAAGVWSAGMYTAELAGLQINVIRDAQERLRQTVPMIPGVAASREVRVGKAAPTIIELARERGSDLIVMGTRGRTGLSHLLMGSVAERVVRSAPCPVLTVRTEHVDAAASQAAPDANVPA
jgi:universal stress protein A